MALPCYANPGPWQDNSSPSTQRWAARLCNTRCSQVDWCARQRELAIEDIGPHAGTGVWAGAVFTHRQMRTAA